MTQVSISFSIRVPHGPREKRGCAVTWNLRYLTVSFTVNYLLFRVVFSPWVSVRVYHAGIMLLASNIQPHVMIHTCSLNARVHTGSIPQVQKIIIPVKSTFVSPTRNWMRLQTDFKEINPALFWRSFPAITKNNKNCSYSLAPNHDFPLIRNACN